MILHHDIKRVPSVGGYRRIGRASADVATGRRELSLFSSPTEC